MLPDDERQHWTLDPFACVGPLRFGMSPGEVSQALAGVTGDSQLHPRRRHPDDPACATEGAYQEFGLNLYYGEERLVGVAVNASVGPQVFAEGVALVGQVPSALEQ